MGKNNSGSTSHTRPHEDQYTPSIRIATQTQREAIQEVIQKVESKRKKTRQTCITSTIWAAVIARATLVCNYIFLYYLNRLKSSLVSCKKNFWILIFSLKQLNQSTNLSISYSLFEIKKYKISIIKLVFNYRSAVTYKIELKKLNSINEFWI